MQQPSGDVQSLPQCRCQDLRSRMLRRRSAGPPVSSRPFDRTLETADSCCVLSIDQD